MSDSKVLISFYDEPLKEFYLYPGCQYKYDGVRCIYLEPLEDTVTDTDKVAIKFLGSETVYSVDRTSLSPIPLTIEELDRYPVSTSYSIAYGTKDWKFESTTPFVIHYNGKYFVYSNPKMEQNNIPPLPVAYLSDVQAAHNSYLSQLKHRQLSQK